MIESLTPQQVTQFSLTNAELGVTFNAALIISILREFDERYTVEPDILYAWSIYTAYSSPDFWKAYAALNAQYNPLNNYDMSETETEQHHDGDIDNIRSTDNAHNTISTATGTDVSATVTAGSGVNAPKTERYTTTYDNDSTGRLQSYDVNSGQTTTRTTGTAADNVATVTDDLKETRTEQHKHTTATVNGFTITADKISGRTLVRSGNIGVMSSQQLITAEIVLRSQSLLYDYICRFIDRYTYFAGGACVEYDIDII